MTRATVVLHTKLPFAAVNELLRQGLDASGPRPWRFLWFISIPLLVKAWITGPQWNDPSRQVIRSVDGRMFRLERRHRVPMSASFYGSWEANDTGTKIEGYFALPIRVLYALRGWFIIVAGMGALGVVLNALDLTIGTHFTVDPRFGLILSTVMVLVSTGIYYLAKWIGSRPDAGAIAFIERTLSASRSGRPPVI
jgi:hypothetical protein